MKNSAWILVSCGFLALAFAPAACVVQITNGEGGSSTTTGTTSTTDSSTSTNTTSTTTGTTGTTSTTTTSTTTTSTTTTGSADCTGLLMDACGTCAEASCCTELAACAGDSTGNCFDCLTGAASDMALCDAEPTKSLVATMTACATTNCQAACYAVPAPSCDAPATAASAGSCVTIDVAAGIECNPITNEGCDINAGEVCDFMGTGFTCYPPPNDAALCGACSNSGSGPFCAGTLHCLEDQNGGKCSRFCCDDGDCGSGSCDMSLSGVAGVGFCVAP